MENSTTHPPESTAPAPPADPLKALQEQLKTLQQQSKASQQQIAAAEQQAQQSAAGLESARTLKKEADARESALNQLLTDIQNSQLAAGLQRQTAAKEGQAALDSYQDISRELAEQLSAEHREELDHVVQSVDEAIAGLKEHVADLKEASAELREAAEQAKKAVPEKEAALKAAQEAHKGLAKSIQEARSHLNKKLAAMQESFQKGLINPAYLQAGEMKAALEGLAGLADPAHETGLVAEIQLAWTGLAQAKAAQEQTSRAWKAHQDELAAAEAALSGAEAARWEQILAGVQELMETAQS